MMFVHAAAVYLAVDDTHCLQTWRVAGTRSLLSIPIYRYACKQTTTVATVYKPKGSMRVDDGTRLVHGSAPSNTLACAKRCKRVPQQRMRRLQEASRKC